MQIDSLDHLVLTVSDIQATIEFYSRVLGMEVIGLEGSDEGENPIWSLWIGGDLFRKRHGLEYLA